MAADHGAPEAGTANSSRRTPRSGPCNPRYSRARHDQTPVVSGSRSRWRRLRTGNSSLRGRFETPLFAMVVAVGLVLLVACANIASLLLARALARRRELSVRLALGSSRWRIARLLFIESLIVAVTGAAFGLMFAKWSSALLVQQLSTWESTVSLDLALDWRVLAFTAALACLSAITAGVAPVIGLRSVTAGGALKDAGRGIAGDRRFAVRSTLVVAQIAVSLVLVVAAGLFLRTFASLNQLPLGFEPEPLLVVELNLQASGGPPEERGARVERLRDAAAAVPGVRSASVSADAAPRRGRLGNRSGRRRRWADGTPEVPRPALPLAERHDTRLVRDDGHVSAQRSGFRRRRPRGQPPRCHRQRSIRPPVSAGRSADRAARASGIRCQDAPRDRRRRRRRRLRDAARGHAGDDVCTGGAATAERPSGRRCS